MGRVKGEVLEFCLEGCNELVECGMYVFVFFVEFLGFVVCECEEEAVCSGTGLLDSDLVEAVSNASISCQRP